MKELISILTIILLIISAQSCRGEDITEEPFYLETKKKTGNALRDKKMDSVIIILNDSKQETSPADGETEPPPKDGIRWKVKQ
ncbi:hypothetical protein HNP38_002527 [Chryseobacterium defluvii]|uniref:Lipoprotein n=1 Tax=Chryseobacterium defluvii TaxID=160396 RepID=A0A840KIB1_9FLAO|nr:hypothetical protein [Chryseobacterium defluvii]MBB4807223.1 hypothetical protein [Chryseobacterium defluvii]